MKPIMGETKIKLLIIDDHRIVLDGYRNLLEAEGFIVLGCADNANDGLESYKELKPDVTLMDISMPGNSGLTCIQNIIDYDNAARIIVCTMYDETQMVVKVMQLGAKGFITKANSLSIMTKAIKKVNSNGFYLAEKYAQTIAMLDLEENKKLSEETFFQLDKLTEKELSIFKMVAEGHSSKKIAKQFSLSENTIANYRSRILKKVGVKNTHELMLCAIKNGIISSRPVTNFQTLS